MHITPVYLLGLILAGVVMLSLLTCSGPGWAAGPADPEAPLSFFKTLRVHDSYIWKNHYDNTIYKHYFLSYNGVTCWVEERAWVGYWQYSTDIFIPVDTAGTETALRPRMSCFEDEHYGLLVLQSNQTSKVEWFDPENAVFLPQVKTP